MTIVCNIAEIVKLAKGESETQLSKMTQSEQDTYEMHVRAANIVSCTGITSECNYQIYYLYCLSRMVTNFSSIIVEFHINTSICH